MASWPSSERIHFLYRTDQGRVDREEWRRGALALLAILSPFVGMGLALAPYTDHDLSKTPLFDPMVALAYSYLIVFAIVAMLVAISFVNLSAKRFRAIGLQRTSEGRPSLTDRLPPLALASLIPLTAFLDGAAHWIQVRIEDVMPHWQVYPFDLCLVVVTAWTIYELGFAPERGNST
jgi:uncharacterized membrane protein YhaH (DUF805 family)